MPVFKWGAIDLAGNTHKGIDFAISQGDLEQLLQQRHLGLMFCQKLKTDFYRSKIKILDQLNFFHDLQALLQAGMPLPQVLQLYLNQTKNLELRLIVGYLLYQVQDQGANFGQALQSFRSVFGNLVVVVLQAGFNVGNLTQALSHVCRYLDQKLQMQRELKRAILMPVLTLVLFLAIALLVFIIIVPQFAHIFETANMSLDQSTKMVLALSNFFRSTQSFICLLTIWLLGLLSYLFTKTKVGKFSWHTILLYTPLVGKLIRYQNLFSFLQSSAILLEGGVPAIEAFECANGSISNVVLQRKSIKMTKLVEQGTAINLAMQQVAPGFFTSEVRAMVLVGEESGSLGAVLGRISDVYKQRFKALLQIILSLIQPVLIICLGLLVALLIFAIYVPIFNMPAMIE